MRRLLVTQNNLINLSEEQLSIVTSTATNIIVNAGAGAGKTRVLVERVKHLLKQGVNPTSIVVITFTNMAADELKERLAPIKGSSNCFVGTIHSYANMLLKRSGYQFEIFSEQHQDQFMKNLIADYAYYINYDYYLVYKEFVHNCVLGKEDKSNLYNVLNCNYVNEIEILLGKTQPISTQEYPHNVKTVCKLNSIITFTELISITTKFFEELNCSLEYLFVDEFQDVGYLEYDFLKSLNANNNFFIGDDYQAIYSFKGGDVNIFLHLILSDDWTTYYLKDNYRNSRLILDMANQVIQRADNIIKKDSCCKNSDLGIVEFKDKSDIVNYLKKCENLKDWFVLVRLNKEIELLSNLFKKFNIPFICFKQSQLTPEELRKATDFKGVKLLTIHSSKGLESKNVCLYGDLPINPKKKTSSDNIKLLYVGMTRAQEKLIIFN